MKRTLWTLAIALTLGHLCLAQHGGGVVYGQPGGAAGAENNEHAKRTLADNDMPPSPTSSFLDASVLINVKADEYVAEFGMAADGKSVEDANRKVDGIVANLKVALKPLGVKDKDLYVDFAVQNRVYGYDLEGDLAREKLVGFEVKKNLTVHYKGRDLLEKLVTAAASVNVHDLIKVDYVVKDVPAIHAKLLSDAAHIVRQKAASYAALLGMPVGRPQQILVEKYSAYYPSEMYDSYTAGETEDAGNLLYRGRYNVVGARKSRTFYYNALTSKSFDHVINPVVTEPVVQFTVYLKVKYEAGSGQAAQPVKHVKRSAKHGKRAHTAKKSK